MCCQKRCELREVDDRFTRMCADVGWYMDGSTTGRRGTSFNEALCKPYGSVFRCDVQCGRGSGPVRPLALYGNEYHDDVYERANVAATKKDGKGSVDVPRFARFVLHAQKVEDEED